ncbi:MAG: PD40 domain-containing protein [Gemmatimonadota bacterium]|nr:MAG: PD40 domain-containing protein [Gemmatimonadota bacterium]
MNPHRVITAVLALTLVAAASGYAQQTAEELYQAGLYQEEVQGNLESAIDLYRRILEDFPDNRALGAKAQLHVGLCYEKLGLQEARQAYRRVIDEYPGYADEVAVARDRLASLQRALAELNRQPTLRKIEIASRPQSGVLSPDGSNLAFVSEGGVWVVPLQGSVGPDIAGEPIRIAEVDGAWDRASLMSWSADGEWIAVNGAADGEEVVYVIPAGGGEPRVVRMPPRAGFVWGFRISLSPDGQTVAFSAKPESRQGDREDSERYIWLAPTGGGEPEQLTYAPSRLPAFSPDGELVAYVGYRAREDITTEVRENLEASYDGALDGDLWVVPSAGGTPVKLAQISGRVRGPVWSPDGRFIAAHYEPESFPAGSKEIWVFPLSPDASSAGEPTKIALPGESWWLVSGWTPNDELGLFTETESRWAIYTVPATGGKAVQVTPPVQVTPAGTYHLRPRYSRWSADGERIYLRWREGMDQLAAIAYVPAAGGDVVQVPVLSERRLVSTWPGGGQNISPVGERMVMSAVQRPLDRQEGLDIWTIPLDGGNPTRLTSDRSSERYPCWSPDGGWVAFIDWHAKAEDEGFYAIYMVLADGGEIRQITSEADSVGDGAIAFSPDGERIAFFSGNAIKTIPVEGGKSEVLVGHVRSDEYSQLAWSPDGSKIAHNAAGKIWITRLDGGTPEELRTGLPRDAELSDVSWSPDGEKIAFVGSTGGDAEFWLISDFLPSQVER